MKKKKGFTLCLKIYKPATKNRTEYKIFYLFIRAFINEIKEYLNLLVYIKFLLVLSHNWIKLIFLCSIH